MKTTSIWLVHETLHMLMLMRNTIVVHGGHDVRCFTNSFDVIELVLQGTSPDILVAEDRLTGMSGNELLTLAGSIDDRCSGILLVSPDADHCSYQRHIVVEGVAGFHKSLVQTIHAVAKKDGKTQGVLAHE
jgi:response regulator RpfG family c-di-GMP phosphodiesterase